MLSLEKAVLRSLRRLPKGAVTTYGALARFVGASPRTVGVILSRNVDPAIPCHRVVAHDGGISGYNRGVSRKIRLLKREGVAVSGTGRMARVDLKQYLWHPSGFIRS